MCNPPLYSALAGACIESITLRRYGSKFDYLFAEEDERGWKDG